jgi:hypothetical protein
MTSAFRPLRWSLPAIALVLAACGEPRLSPELGSAKQPVIIPRAPAALTIDGDGADWANVAALPAPFSRQLAGRLKLAWSDAGLSGFLQTTDAKISADPFSPWTKDCLEFWFESDNAHSYDMTDHSWQLVLAPNPDAGPGRAIVCPANGHLDVDQIKAQWKPIPGGYALEFFIPAAQLKATFQPGTRFGMNYAVDDDGIAVEEFYADKDMNSAFASPSRWGVIELGK